MTWDAERPCLGGVEPGDRRTVEQHDGAALGLVNPADDLDQRALATAVLTREAEHFARHDLEADVAQRFDAPEALRQVLELEQGPVRVWHGE